MRVLVLAPWFRTLAGLWADALRPLGHEVFVVTSPRHFESSPADFVLAHGPRQPAGVPELARLRRAVRDFAPDVVLADEVRDPRLLALVPRTPLVLLVHDAKPHDATHRRPWRHEFVVRTQHHRATRFVTFSACVRERLRSSVGSERPVDVVALPSEMGDDLVPAFVPAAGRRDFALVGRLGPYKNIPAVFTAWTRHVESARYAGDRLLVIGGGELGVDLPPHTVRFDGAFTFADTAPTVAATKATFALYQAGSQSGVQRWSMQLGVSCIVSDVGGLAEGLPPDEPAFAPDDVAGVADRIGELADPGYAEARGRVGQRHYQQHYSAARSAEQLADVLAKAIGQRSRGV